MKKKLTLLGVLVVSFLFCVAGVSALERVYPEYAVGDKLYWNDTNHYKCDSAIAEHNSSCKEYTVTEASDSTKDTIKTVDSDSQEKTLNKGWFIVGYVLKATKETEITLSGEASKFGLGDGDPAEQTGVTKVIYFDDIDDVIDAIVNAEKYDHIYTKYLYTDELTIKKDTFVTTGYCDADSLIVNGVLKVEGLYVGNIEGNGLIKLSYTNGVDIVPDSSYYCVEDAIRFSVDNVSGVKVNIINEDLKEGLLFGAVGTINYYTLEEAQEIIDMYNSVLDVDGYELVLDGEQLMSLYYGKLVKKPTTTTEVKNPKTSDSIMNIVAIMALVGAGTFITVKKLKNN